MSYDNKTNRELLDEKAEKAFALPGVLALDVGPRQRGGRLTDESAIVVTVERKLPPDLLPKWQDLRELFGVDRVDVVQASPLQALFAAPEKYGVDLKTLDELEARVGFPFSPGAIGVRRRPPGADVLAARPRDRITYQPPPGVQLEELRGRITLRCHAGPDAGWKELRPFLLATQNELVAGMFELTAPHIGDLLVQQLSRPVRVFKLTMDKKCLIGSGMKKFDRHDREHVRMFEQAFGEGFEHANAFTSTNGGTFARDYHIKLVVRDRKAFWLSSGSWQSSNQPDIDPLGDGRNDARLPICNREWHVTGSNAELSDVWAKFLEGDLKTAIEAQQRDLLSSAAVSDDPDGPIVFAAARIEEAGFPYEEFFEPRDFELVAGDDARVMPLLTPDNYIEEVTCLVESATNELLVQNQSLGFLSDPRNQDPRFTAFIAALARQSHALPNFKFIVRAPFGGSEADVLNIYEQNGFDRSKFRFQPRCHNKGIIADGERVLVGSHNITNGGTTTNRDASLIIHHRGIAAYFAKIFAHDWRVAGDLARDRPAAPPMILARPGEEPPPGMKAYRLWDVLDW